MKSLILLHTIISLISLSTKSKKILLVSDIHLDPKPLEKNIEYG
jgi:hypothetical protein